MWFLSRKVCPVDRHTDRHTYTKVNPEDTLSGFRQFFLQHIIKDRSNKVKEEGEEKGERGKGKIIKGGTGNGKGK